MKLFSVAVLSAISLGLSFLCSNCSNSCSARASERAEKTTIERYYFVQGMTCGGCVFGVKHALKKAGIADSQIMEVDYKTPDPKNKVGHVKLKFSKEQYLGQETDCKIVREIHQSPGYTAYWNKDNTNPCKIN